MTDDFPLDTAHGAAPYKVGTMPTEDGDKVVLVLRADQEDQRIIWFDTAAAKNLSEALIVTACRIEAEGSAHPPTKN